MSKDGEKLNIVDEQGNIIGEETRENIHKQGLRHREIHVWFYTSKSEIIFQHRAKDKETYPDLLDATVGGHVEIGMSFEDAVLQELEEETGISESLDNLSLIKITSTKSYDSVTENINNAIRAVYAYKYDGKVEDLKIEQGKGLGFETWPFEKIFNLSSEEKKRFIPKLLNETCMKIFKKIEKLV